MARELLHWFTGNRVSPSKPRALVRSRMSSGVQDGCSRAARSTDASKVPRLCILAQHSWLHWLLQEPQDPLSPICQGLSGMLCLSCRMRHGSVSEAFWELCIPAYGMYSWHWNINDPSLFFSHYTLKLLGFCTGNIYFEVLVSILCPAGVVPSCHCCL